MDKFYMYAVLVPFNIMYPEMTISYEDYFEF